MLQLFMNAITKYSAINLDCVDLKSDLYHGSKTLFLDVNLNTIHPPRVPQKKGLTYRQTDNKMILYIEISVSY